MSAGTAPEEGEEPMELDLNMLKPQERVSLQLRLLYEQSGFRKYHMSRFEEYGLYQETVSYTHLDVYKRQPGRRCAWGPWRRHGPGQTGPMARAMPFYTATAADIPAAIWGIPVCWPPDVYKRQVLWRKRTTSMACRPFRCRWPFW